MSEDSPSSHPDPFEAVKALWSSMGFPMPGMSGMMAPTFDSAELDKRIADLKAVEGWLQMNLGLLQTTLHGLEMQRNALAAMQAGLQPKNQDKA